MLSEVAERFVLVAKEDMARERRHERASACPRSDMVGLVVRGTVREADARQLGWDRGHMRPAERALSRSHAPMEWAWARCLRLVA